MVSKLSNFNIEQMSLLMRPSKVIRINKVINA